MIFAIRLLMLCHITLRLGCYRLISAIVYPDGILNVLSHRPVAELLYAGLLDCHGFQERLLILWWQRGCQHYHLTTNCHKLLNLSHLGAERLATVQHCMAFIEYNPIQPVHARSRLIYAWNPLVTADSGVTSTIAACSGGLLYSHSAHLICSSSQRCFMSALNAVIGTITTVVPAPAHAAGSMNVKLLPLPVPITAKMRLFPS